VTAPPRGVTIGTARHASSRHPSFGMYAIAILRYRRPLDEVIKSQDAHRAYLRTLLEQGTLIASGPLDPRNGGALLLRVPDEDFAAALDRVRDGDPFWQEGIAQYELLPWRPVMGIEALDALVRP
jgi:uncharacterized protein YciI